MSPSRTAVAAPTRREASRAATLAAIKSAALRQVEEQGAPALSVRGVARAVGLSPAGMYRYYDSRDALLTDLLVDAYSDLADTVSAAAGLTNPVGPGTQPASTADVLAEDPGVPDPAGALLGAIQAYRTWAVANPSRFLLVFGTPVPGYTAPADGPTVAANRRMGRAFFTLGALAWRDCGQAAGAMSGPERPATPQEGELLDQLRSLAPDLPAAAVPRMLAGWALWHGLVTLEITGQLHWAYPDSAAYFTETMSAWVDGFLGRG